MESKRLLESLVTGKSVAILGSAPNVLDCDSDEIDSFGTVVRMNNYNFEKYKGKIGTRTDIYYSYFGRSIKKKYSDFRREGVKLIYHRLPYLDFTLHTGGEKVSGVSHDFRKFWDRVDNSIIGDIPVYRNSAESFYKSFLLNNRILTTGVNCIFDILNLSPAVVKIFGFDFFKSKKHNIEEHWKEGDGGHDNAFESDLVWALWLAHKNFQMHDSVVDDIVKGRDKYKLFKRGGW